MNEEQKKNLIAQLKDQETRFGVDMSAQIKQLTGGESWQDQVDSCKTKNELEELVMKEKGVDIDKRKKLSELKTEAKEM